MICRIVILAAVAAGVVACAGRPEPIWVPDQAQAKLVDLAVERLELAHDIAWFKYREGLPIRERRREREVIRGAVARGRQMGLSSWQVSRFFRAQVAASRMYQARLIQRWQAGGELPARPPRHLERDLRPRIEHLDARIVNALAAAGRGARNPELAARAERYLLARDVPRDIALVAIAPLR